MAIDREKLIEKIKTLEGLTMQERNDLVAYLREQKRYGLVWEDKPEDVEQRLRTELPVLKEVKSRAIISDDPNAPNHILIEGDNLEALTTLAYTHEGKIDVIYIDPPYNTGNKDFVYNDSYVDREDGYRHSKWLSFMAKRLRIAKRLLSDRGVIFISIDDNEQAQLKLLCDDFLGGNNFLAQIIWERAYAPVNLKKHFSESHDYIICYAKNIEIAKNNGLPRSEEANSRYSNPDNDPRGVWKASDFSVGPVVESKLYPITTPSGRIVYPPKGRCWIMDEESFKIQLEDNRIWFGPDGNNVPAGKRFLSEVKGGITPMTIWKYTEVGHSQDATKQLKELFGGQSLFSYPKSVKLIGRCIQLYSDKKSIILDFFAGSGTTLHATMQLNAEDGGKRQCILVTNNENGICENVTYERNKRVIQGYTTPKGEHVAGLTDNNLRYYRTAFVGRRRTPQNMRRLMLLASDMLCIKENIYTEVGEFGGLETLANGFCYFANNEKQMLIIYDEMAIYTIVDLLWDMDVKRPIITYVFSPANDPWQIEFADVEDKVRLTALPAAIYNAYKRVLPKPDLETKEEAKEDDKGEQNNIGGLFDLDEEGGQT